MSENERSVMILKPRMRVLTSVGGGHFEDETIEKGLQTV